MTAAKDKVMYVMDERKVGTAFSLANGKQANSNNKQ